MLNVLNVLNVLKLLNVLNLLNMPIAQGPIVGLLGLVLLMKGRPINQNQPIMTIFILSFLSDTDNSRLINHPILSGTIILFKFFLELFILILLTVLQIDAGNKINQMST